MTAPAPDSPPPAPRRRLWPRLLLATVSFALTLGLLEGGARVYRASLGPVLLRDGIYVNRLPLFTGDRHDRERERPRGDPLPVEKEEGELRVFVYGESSVEGMPLGLSASAPTVLRDLLADALPGRKVTVVNMGRAGSIAPNAYYYLLLSERYRPDFVVFYMGMNDDSDMPGEACELGRHPARHAAWRAFAERSALAWVIRLEGPRLLWALGSKANGPRDCTLATFHDWTDILVGRATAMGARVLVTTPVRSEVDVVEPGVEPGPGDAIDPAAVDPAYRELLRCRLTPGCDFVAAFDRDVRSCLLCRAAIDRIALLRIDYLWGSWKRSAGRFGADFIDFRAALAGAAPRGILADRPFFADEIHLTAQGYAWLARFWAGWIAARAKGAEPPASPPPFPRPEDVRRYREDAKSDGMQLMKSYLRRGYMLTVVPGIEEATSVCPGGLCSDEPSLAMAWLRRVAGLDPGLPEALAGRLDAWSPATADRR